MRKRKGCEICGTSIQSKGKICRRCYVAKGSTPSKAHPWRHEPVADPNRVRVPAPISRKGRPSIREIVFRGTLEECRVIESLRDGFPEGRTIRYEIRRRGED